MHINSLGAAKWPGQMRLYTTSPRMGFNYAKRVHCINTDENNARPIYVINSVDLPISECTVKEIWIPARGQFILEKEPREMLVTDAARTVYAHGVSYGHDGANRIVDSLGSEYSTEQSKLDAFTDNVPSDETLQMVSPEPWQQRRTYDGSLVHCVNTSTTSFVPIHILDHPTNILSQCEVGRIYLPPGAQFTLKKKPDEYLVTDGSQSIYAHATSYHGQQIIEPIGISQSVLKGYYPGTTQTGTDFNKAQLVYCCNESTSNYAQIVILSYSGQWEFTKSAVIPPSGYMVIKKEPNERLMGTGPDFHVRGVKVTFTNV